MIETERLSLRRWQPRDRDALWAQVSDPEVMRFLLAIPDAAAFEAHLARLDQWQADNGFTFWVVERRADGAVLGVCGLKRGGAGTPIADSLEIGWRLARAHWGQGYAREAAQAVLGWAWANTDADQVWAITVEQNPASWGLMERLGMSRRHDLDFDHPQVSEDSPYRRHIAYVVARPVP